MYTFYKGFILKSHAFSVLIMSNTISVIIYLKSNENANKESMFC